MQSLGMQTRQPGWAAVPSCGGQQAKAKPAPGQQVPPLPMVLSPMAGLQRTPIPHLVTLLMFPLLRVRICLASPGLLPPSPPLVLPLRLPQAALTPHHPPLLRLHSLPLLTQLLQERHPAQPH